jgi:hypothetical protein
VKSILLSSKWTRSQRSHYFRLHRLWLLRAL